MGIKSLHQRIADGLDDEVNMRRAMGPKADVDLPWRAELLNDTRCLAKQRSEFLGFVISEVGDVDYVPIRFHDEGSDPQRTDAVLDEPMLRAMDQAAGACLATASEIARKASFDVVHRHILSEERTSRVRLADKAAVRSAAGLDVVTIDDLDESVVGPGVGHGVEKVLA